MKCSRRPLGDEEDVGEGTRTGICLFDGVERLPCLLNLNHTPNLLSLVNNLSFKPFALSLVEYEESKVISLFAMIALKRWRKQQDSNL